ncbi:fibroleukin isoform X1 [Drosophila willistoni]|uniref:fibroleukin isoform X1 n=1 Tax=Drosophila willistoni TaxID=7260 RepID=UPI000C26CD14|nr:fibroleukin isoform X1 [Drosophila willistoni]
MDKNLHLQLNMQTSTSSSSDSDGNVLCESMRNLDFQCNNGCYRKIKLLLQNALQDKSTIKELEIQLAKLEVNVSTAADKIKDKDEVIAALKMSIAFCKNNNYNNGNNNNDHNESSSRLDDLKATLRDKDIQLAHLQGQLKETEARTGHLLNHIRNVEAMNRSSSNPHIAEIIARDRHIGELKKIIDSKDAQIVLLDLESSNHTKADSVAELKEKTELLAKQETIIKEQTIIIENLQSEIEQNDVKLQENVKLLAICKAQLKEKDDRQAEKLLKDAKAKINSYTNTIKQLKQNNIDLQTGATASKAENLALQQTIEELTNKLSQIEKKSSNSKAEEQKKLETQKKLESQKKLETKKKIESKKEDKFTPHAEVEELVASGWLPIQSRHIQYSSSAFMLDFQFQCTGFNYEDKQIWMGLEPLHIITNLGRHELYIHVVDFDNSTCYARYDNFVVDSGKHKYKLKSLGKYTGDAGDAMRQHENNEFSIMQRGASKSHCHVSFWWHAKPEDFESSCDLSAIKLPGYRTSIWWMGDVRKSVTMLIKAFKN